MNWRHSGGISLRLQMSEDLESDYTSALAVVFDENMWRFIER